jgi:hypothetical protein
MFLSRVTILNVALTVLSTLSFAVEALYQDSNSTSLLGLPVGVTDEITKLNGFNIRMSSIKNLYDDGLQEADYLLGVPKGEISNTIFLVGIIRAIKN